MRDTLRVVYNNVRRNVSQSQRRQKDYYDRLTSGERLKPQHIVWLFTPPTPKDQPAMFYKLWSGPWTVVTQLSDVNYRIKNESKKKSKAVHFNWLKACNVVLNTNEPEEVAESESDEEVVEVQMMQQLQQLHQPQQQML